MSPTAMAFIMIIIVIALILWNKIPMNFIMFVVPFVCALVMKKYGTLGVQVGAEAGDGKAAGIQAKEMPVPSCSGSTS